ncbi:superoxide dismutase family protein [Cohnella sp.]|uniref:superoxide dismutase family protein n=1 Tax=Cohnella sp. TaxID=1883426 RepID=UPI003704BA6C
MWKNIRTQLIAGLLGIALVSGSAGSAIAAEETSAVPDKVKVKIINDKGHKIGTAVLTEEVGAVRIHLKAKKLPPGIHGIHFHEVGKCEPPKFESAGAHLNPYQKQHGFNNPQGFHAGDLLNIEVGPDGKVETDLISKTVTLKRGEPNSLLRDGGTSLMIHEKEDDYVTDPSGNSGNRIACGPIL